MKEGTRQLVAFLCLSAASLIGSQTYKAQFLWFFSREYSFLPDLISGVIALSLIRPVLVGDLHHSHRVNVVTWINFGLLFYVTAVFANIGLGGNTSLLKTPSSILVLLVILFANLNVKRYGELVVPILLAFGAINISSASKAMGFPGFILIGTAAIGSAFLIDLSRVKQAVLGKPKD